VTITKRITSAGYAWYTSRLRGQLAGRQLPGHVAIVMDGNRRWARQMGFGNVSLGHQYGAEHLEQVLDWCAEVGIRRVTVFVASTDNLRKRESAEMRFLMQVIEDVIVKRMLAPTNRWQIHVAGRLDMLPDSTAHALKEARDTTADRATDADLTVAVGYDGRQEIVDAVRSLLDHQANTGRTLAELANRLTADDIGAHLYTSGQPDPDLVIRTSGEVRMSGFLLWQAAYAELYFCDVYWPAFRKIDFFRALRAYAGRRRLGG
jgi:short-chain Z-isoprenyl diphosphate synthase